MSLSRNTDYANFKLGCNMLSYKHPGPCSSLALVLILFIFFASSVEAHGVVATSSWPPDACTDKSFSIPSWIIDDFNIESPSTAAAAASFSVINRATNLSMNLTCQILEGACRIDGTDQDKSLRIALSMSGKTSRLSLTQSWTCNDKRTINNETKPCVLSPGFVRLPLTRVNLVCSTLHLELRTSS